MAATRQLKYYKIYKELTLISLTEGGRTKFCRKLSKIHAAIIILVLLEQKMCQNWLQSP